MREGPEHRHGWRDRFEVDGVQVEVLARHSRSTRPPRGHEIVRQMTRGRPPGLVEETRHEWAVLPRGGRTATVRQWPSGLFAVGGARDGHATLRQAAESHARAEAAIRARAAERRSAEEAVGADEPEPPRGP